MKGKSLTQKEKLDKLVKREEMYLYYDLEEVAVHYIPGPDDFVSVKRAGKDPYPVNKKTDLATNAFFYGREITKEEFKNF